MKSLAVLAALAIAAPLVTTPLGSASAAEPINLNVRTSRDLAELCGVNPKEAAADAKINFCHGFAQGAVDVYLQTAGNKKAFCFPSPAPRRTQTMNEFVAWVRALPDHQKLGATQGLFQFLGERFPCKG
ncbi:MAG: hypothetical protein J0H67_01510 [Rhodospirillales bacterium]|nr:hypothetical protein [Rhodospirillales bacterium]MBN8896592.1 hypothetical protein [Rhodospirillales bacterium]